MKFEKYVASGDGPDPQGLRILVVDDNHDAAEMVSAHCWSSPAIAPARRKTGSRRSGRPRACTSTRWCSTWACPS